MSLAWKRRRAAGAAVAGRRRPAAAAPSVPEVEQPIPSDDEVPAPVDEQPEDEQPDEAAAAPGAFDPSGHTIPAVLAYVQENPLERAAVLAAEQAGKARKSLVAALSS